LRLSNRVQLICGVGPAGAGATRWGLSSVFRQRDLPRVVQGRSQPNPAAQPSLSFPWCGSSDTTTSRSETSSRRRAPHLAAAGGGVPAAHEAVSIVPVTDQRSVDTARARGLMIAGYLALLSGLSARASRRDPQRVPTCRRRLIADGTVPTRVRFAPPVSSRFRAPARESRSAPWLSATLRSIDPQP